MGDSIRLGDVLRIKHGYAFPGELFSDDPEYPVIVTPGNFSTAGGFRTAKLKTFVGDYPPEYVLKPGTVIVTMTDLSKDGATLGLGAVVPQGAVYLHNQRIGLIEVTDPHRIDRRFLSYYLRTSSYRAEVLGTASGSTVRHTSPSRIEAHEACLPDLDEQQAIAEVLGALDDKIAANDCTAGAANKLARAHYQAATSSAERDPFLTVLDPVLGGTPSRSDDSSWDGSVPWVSAKDVSNADHGVVVATTQGISAKAALAKRLRPLPAGSVVLTARGTVGKVARLGIAASINQSCYGFAPGEIPKACLLFMIERAALDARLMAHGSVFDTITMSTFDHVTVPRLEPAMWASVEVKVAPLLAVGQQAAMENLRLTTARDELLPLLMSGKVRVRAAERVASEAH